MNIEHDYLIIYQPFGPLTGWTWANGSQSQRGYDLDGRLISQSLGNTTRNLGYDDNGNITAINDPANSRLFDYDALNRLTAANDNTFNLAWDYDANGNRLSETDTGVITPYTTEAASNRLLEVGATAYQYDPNGNLVHDGQHSYQYNTQNRLASVDEGATAEYRYNALGQRIYKRGISSPCDVNSDGEISHDDLKLVTGKNAVTFEADGPGKGKAQGKGQSIACIAMQMNNGQGKEKESQSGNRQILFSYDEHRLLGEYDTQGNPIQETIWLNNLPVATIQNGTIYNIHTDHLGTPRVITDSSNMEVWRWDSDPFGIATANEDPDGDGVAVTYKLRFAGQYHDHETGLSYNINRDYKPKTGKYIESDPIGVKGGVNTYSYVYNNTLTFTDPFGLCSCIAMPELKAKNDVHKPHFWGHRRIVTCMYKCTNNGRAELVEGTHTETYILHYTGDDIGDEGDCIGAVFEETYEQGWNAGRFVKRRIRYSAFDPVDSDKDSEKLKSWAEENCACK